jgi:type II secretory pathway pseudopilin PulG
MSLIELIIGLAISSVISLMVAQFFSIVVRLNRSSTEISALQREAETVFAQFERQVMSAEAIFYSNDRSGCFLMTGRDTPGVYSVSFDGAVFYFDRETRKLYADMEFHEETGHSALFNSLRAKSEIGRICEPEYLISNKVEDFQCTLDADSEKMVNLANKHIDVNGRFRVSADLTMQYHESRSYNYHTTAMPREAVEELVWDEHR